MQINTYNLHVDIYDVIIYMWIFKYGICTVTQMNVISETERESQSHRTDLWLSKRRWRAEEGWIGSSGLSEANYYIQSI